MAEPQLKSLPTETPNLSNFVKGLSGEDIPYLVSLLAKRECARLCPDGDFASEKARSTFGNWNRLRAFYAGK